MICPVCYSENQVEEPDPSIAPKPTRVVMRCQDCGIRWDGWRRE